MSCCCCPSPAGIRKKERLVRREEEEEEEEEEESRRKMDVSLLREQYRSTRETQRRHTQVLLRTVSDELSETVSVVPVTQGLTSPWEPNGVTFDPDPATCGDPWRVHLDLHRRGRHADAARLSASSPETTTNANSFFRSSSSSSESACSSFCSTTEEVNAGGSRGDPATGFSDRSRGDPGTGFSDQSRGDLATAFSDRSRGDPATGFSERSREDPGTGFSDGSRGDPEKTYPVQVSVSGSLDISKQSPSDGYKEDHPPSGSDDGPSSSSPSILQEDLKEDQSSTTVPQTDLPSAWRDSRKFSASAFTRQLSVGGVGSSTGVQQNQNYHPFPNRKTPRISEAARRLGMYSSF